MAIPIDNNTTLLNALKEKAQALPSKGATAGGVDLSVVTAGASDVLYSKVIVGANGLEAVGTMPNKAGWSSTTDSNGTVSIPEGYHDGTGGVTVNVSTSSSIPSDGTATTSDVRSGKTFYSGGSKKTGTMSTVTLGTPSITVSNSGLITAEVTHSSSGYVASGTKQYTKQLSTFSTTSVTPGKNSTTLSTSGKYCTANIIVQGDSNLLAENIKSGTSIFGVTGTYSGGSGSSGGSYAHARLVGTASSSQSFYVSGVPSDCGSDSDIVYIHCTRSSGSSGTVSNKIISGYIDRLSGQCGICKISASGNFVIRDSTSDGIYFEVSKQGSTLLVLSQYESFNGDYYFYLTYIPS